MRRHLLPGQCLCLSECVWITDQPSQDLREFWAEGYPGIRDVAGCLELARAKGWTVLDHFLIGEQCWRDFYGPLENRAKEFQDLYPNQTDACIVVETTLREIELFKTHPRAWDYLFLVLQK